LLSGPIFCTRAHNNCCACITLKWCKESLADSANLWQQVKQEFWTQRHLIQVGYHLWRNHDGHVQQARKLRAQVRFLWKIVDLR